MNGLRQKLVRGVAWTLTQQGGQQIVWFAALLMLASILGPDAFGLLALAVTFNTMITVCFGDGIRESLVQRDEVAEIHLSSAFYLNLLLSITAMTLVIVLAPFVESFFEAPGLRLIIQVLSLRFVIACLSAVPLALLQRRMEFRAIATRSLFAVTCGGVTAVVMALQGFGVWSLVGKEIVQALVRTIGLWRASSWFPKLMFSLPRIWGLIQFEASLIGNNFSTFLKNRFATLLIGYAMNPTLLGYYDLANNLITGITNMLAVTMSSVAFTGFTRVQHDPERLRAIYLTATRMTALLSFPLFAGLAITAPNALPILLGREWIPVVPVVQVLCGVGALRSIQYFQGSVIRAIGKPNVVFRINLLHGAFVVTSLCVVAAWTDSIVAIAVCQVGCSIAIQPCWIAATRRAIGLSGSMLAREIAVPLISAAAMCVIVPLLDATLVFELQPGLAVLISILTGAVIYIAVTLILAPRFATECRELASSLLSRRET
ncbi:MAG: lipopolysaccharide biosynthesis protein [Planctomycetota bacterium]|nr:lipopolysaccharide biosynthesis protein [Planctomycetota bacterium]